MSQYLKRMVVLSFLTIICVIITGYVQPVYAQPCPFPPCNPDVPISGIELLIALGGAYGIRKLYNKRKGTSS